ncbi:hypothetical protein CHLNCDRAFT_134175 [Chlorella variabilis]|uniref:ADP,ATP carrier protein n=1 Tax=Chlorella variabilis TaxID=554065 RepID=E1ZGB2_CHLVA|nr:hypothetical protein CHLNCDRAFT_134175 [Chlorella variabilis]EFN55123.1 hypothetical protein CHLNCDRAFT_134175 [Chlorella variabilis]|eukprot:XP_005847225.1 hypothetical protein CHLNCDRAFT_134175 [Chlorella variabilis]
MSLLFFLMAFVNTIIDSLKDSLVITAVGGGTEVIPYLTVYAVLPMSMLFLVAYSWGTQRFSREKLFNIIIGIFLTFYAGFAMLYPHHDALHLNSMADQLVTALPSGLSGMVGMIRNWLFTLFYCVSELWGDVVLSLLFWGLANETTSIEDAPLLYPLFGIGANIAQTMAGRVLRLFSDAGSSSQLHYASQLQSIMFLCLGLGGVILALHAWISRTFPKNPKGSTALKLAAQRRAVAAGAASDGSKPHHRALDLEAAVKGLNYCSLEEQQEAAQRNGAAPPPANGTAALRNNGAALPPQQTAVNAAAAAATETPLAGGNHARNGHVADSTQAGSSNQDAAAEVEQQQAKKKRKKEAMSMKDAWQFLCKSPQIQCLAVMALAQGITTNLLDLAWKHYLHKLATTPAAYSAFLGDTAMWTGIVTGTLMFASPLLFDRIGWRGVASVTPNFMLFAGLPFFAGCIAFTFMAGSLAVGPAGMVLFALVMTGAVMQVFSRGAKFSLFKPAEEMVYIGLDDESRTKGKAAIDVVGAQSGKSIGSVLQQALLILSGGTLGGILPLLAVFYAVMLRSWTRAVDDLAEHYDPSHAHRMSVAGSLDEDDVAGVLPPVAVGGGPDGDDYGGAAASAPGRTPTPAY